MLLTKNYGDNIVDEEELSMRDSIEAAITTLGDESGMEPSPNYESTGEVNAKGETAEAQAASEAPAGAIPGEGESGQANAGISAEDKAAADKLASGSAADEQSPGDITKPPVSWTPAAREGWDSIPEPIRQQITKREHEINTALDDGKDNRKRGEQFQGIADKYAQVIAAEGVTDPIQGFEEMMKVMAQLRMGTPQQKAAKIAQFIGGYGVDVGMLDNILAGQPTPGPNGAGDPNRSYIDQQLAPVHQLLDKMSAQEKQQNFNRNQSYMTEVIAFKAANEFYSDVQNDMADMVEMAGKRGYNMPLAEAYTKACAMNPEVSKVLADRDATANLAQGGKVLTSKRNASSSLMSGQQGGAPATEDMDLRETLAAAWDAQTG